MIKWIKNYICSYTNNKIDNDIKNKCGCLCRCPECDSPLNNQTVKEVRDFIYYKCKCGCESKWDFDIAPAPILFSSVKQTKTGAITKKYV